MTQTLRNYRATFILDTRNYEEAVETLVSKLSKEIEAVGGKTGEVKNLGRQDFIRVTDKRHTGDIYVQIDFSATAEGPKALQERLRLERTVKRILIDHV